MTQQKTLAIISLGCDKNRVDTERMLANLCGGNFVTETEDKAQIIIINTCAFIQSARQEAIDTILSAAEFKKNGKLEKLIVTGCLPQKHMDEIKDSLPEVDAFLGISAYDTLLGVIEELYKGQRIAHSDNTDPVDMPDRKLTTHNYAYLKIADGCDNHCTYCTIPAIRGAYRSRTMDSLIRETEGLVKQGVTELILVAQDVTRYGADLYSAPQLPQLLDKLCKTEIKHIRLLYCYPELVTDQLIDVIKNNDKIVKYLDIPLQHVSDRILRLMGRRSTYAQITGLIDKLRQSIPDIAIRTTFIVGFPDETEDDFNTLLDFVRDRQLNNVGIFTYSKEDGTPAAKLSNQVPKREALRRQRLLAAAQREVCKNKNQQLVGKTLRILYEGIDYHRGLFFGRSYLSAPDIDPLVYFSAEFADIGNYYDILITGADGYDLLGKAIK